jgi:hypothetical protein
MLFGMSNVLLFNRWYGLWDLILRFYYRLVYLSVSSGKLLLYLEKEENTKKLNLLLIKVKNDLLEKGVKEVMRKILNEQTKTSYKTLFERIETTGLGEVLDNSRTISTSAREKMDYLLGNMPGGSIGVAGSRGAGKSTLIQVYCGRDRIVTSLNGRLVLPVMVSAPVKYETRDFILYLFKSVCRAYFTIDENNFIERKSHYRKASELLISRRWLNLLKGCFFFGGLLLMFSSPFLRWRYVTGHHEPSPTKNDTIYIKTVGTHVLPNASAEFKRDTSLFTAAINNLFHTLDEPVANLERHNDFFEYYNNALSGSYNTASNCLIYGFLLFGIWIILALVDRHSRNPFGLITQRSYRKFYPFSDGSNPRDKGGLASDAEDWLEKIEFQQSFTSGWSGGIKLPYIESGMTRSNTRTQQPMSNPEIVAGFVDFLRNVSQIYQVIIGIDELDKMESGATAEQFLNDIKSIFGIPRCFFLISVSEDAMSNFERRGLPFRDVFDSAFDSIVYVEHLDLAGTQRLLERRIIGRPAVFFALAYCFAGGLPRDVIRYFREIARLSCVNKELNAITGELIKDDVAAKLRANAWSLKQYRSYSEAVLLFELLFTGSNDLSGSELETMLNELKLQMVKLSNNINTLETEGKDSISNALIDRREIFNLTQEIYAYLAFIVTINQVFTSGLNEAKIKQLENNKSFESLAQVRQLLAIDRSIALKMIDTFRKQEGLYLLAN